MARDHKSCMETWYHLVLLWVAQISCVWGLAEGGRLEGWFVPCLSGTMCLNDKEVKVGEWSAWVILLFNVVISFVLYTKETFWGQFQPAMVTLPLLLAADI